MAEELLKPGKIKIRQAYSEKKMLNNEKWKSTI